MLVAQVLHNFLRQVLGGLACKHGWAHLQTTAPARPLSKVTCNWLLIAAGEWLDVIIWLVVVPLLAFIPIFKFEVQLRGTPGAAILCVRRGASTARMGSSRLGGTS